MGDYIAHHLFEGARTRESYAPDHVNRVGYLRVTQADSRGPAGLCSEMNSAGTIDSDNLPELSYAAGKINIFKPSVERQLLVEKDSVLKESRQPPCQIAAVTVIH